MLDYDESCVQPEENSIHFPKNELMPKAKLVHHWKLLHTRLHACEVYILSNVLVVNEAPLEQAPANKYVGLLLSSYLL